MEKKIYVFVHIPKCFGTSFLRSIENNNINKKNNEIAFYDLFHYHLIKYYRMHFYNNTISYKMLQNIEVDYLKKTILPLFIKSKKRILILHIHADTFSIDKVIPEFIERKYIVTTRDPETRLKSAYVYRSQEARGITDYRKNNFFQSIVYNCGLEYLIPRIFGFEENFFIPAHQLKNIYQVTLDDYVNKSAIIKFLEKEMRVDLSPVHDNKTKAKHGLPGKEDSFFWEQMKQKYQNEKRYYLYMKSNHYTDLFLSY